MNLSPQGASSRRRSPHGGSSRSRLTGRGRSPLATSSTKTHNGTGTRDQPSSRSPSPQGACSDGSISPQGPTSRSPSPQGATTRSPSPQGTTSRSPSPQGATTRSPSPQGATSRSPFPQGVTIRSHSSQGVTSRSPSPRGAFSRSPSPRGAFSRSPSPQGATIRSPSPQGATSRSPSPQDATSRSPSPRGTTNRSPSPRGAFNRSPSPQGDSSRSRPGRKSDDGISPSVTENVTGASTRADGDPGALSSHEPPDGLYGVKVTNFAIGNRRVNKSILTKCFMPYGNVMFVTVHGSYTSRYALVFFTHKHEQENALRAVITNPHGIKCQITTWSGPSPSLFGIVIVNIDDNDLDSCRIRSEFGKFGDITFVHIPGPTQHRRVALVFYRYQKGQEKALASPKPFKTSFGTVKVTAWTNPPPTSGDMPSYDISSVQKTIGRSPYPQGPSSTRSPSPQGPSSKRYTCTKIINVSNSPLSPLVPVHQSNGSVVGVSITSPGVDVQPTTLPSCEPPSSLYGVKVSNFAYNLKNQTVKTFLTTHFNAYGNVFSVIVLGTDRSSRYALVFYKNKYEQERALTAKSKAPLENICITPWDDPFSIMVTNINERALDLEVRIRYEFAIFGVITLVQISTFCFRHFALVFYEDRRGPYRALASMNPLKTSFGEVTLYGWTRPLPSRSVMSDGDILKAISCSPVAAMSASQQKDSLQQPATLWNGLPVAVPSPERRGRSVAIQPRHIPSYMEMKCGNGDLQYSHSTHTLSRGNRSRSPLGLTPVDADRHSRSRYENRRSPLSASARMRTRRSRSRSLCSSVSENRSRSPLSASRRIRTRHSRSRSLCSSVSENRSQSPSSGSTHIRTERSRSSSYLLSNLSPRTKTRYSRCQSPHSNLLRTQSPPTRERYSRCRSPCSYQLYSEHCHMDKRVPAQSPPLRDHRRVGVGDVTPSQKSSLMLWINNIEDTISSAELRAAFKPFGEIEQIQIKESFGKYGKQAFLQYNSLCSVSRAIRHMDGTFLLHCKLQVDFAYPQQATNCLWVYGLPAGLSFPVVTVQFLKDVFQQFGCVQKLLHDSVQGAALVLYNNADSALKATQMNTIGGCSVKWRFANRRLQLCFCESMESSGQDVGDFLSYVGR